MKNLKLVFILLLTFSSVPSFASLDCEDFKSMSIASTLLSRDIANWESRKQLSESDSEVLPLARRIIDELETSIAINAEDNPELVTNLRNQIDSAYDQTEQLVIRSMRQGHLQYLNGLRVQQMSRIRQLYARCLR